VTVAVVYASAGAPISDRPTGCLYFLHGYGCT